MNYKSTTLKMRTLHNLPLLFLFCISNWSIHFSYQILPILAYIVSFSNYTNPPCLSWSTTYLLILQELLQTFYSHYLKSTVIFFTTTSSRHTCTLTGIVYFTYPYHIVVFYQIIMLIILHWIQLNELFILKKNEKFYHPVKKI
jgi:hypothetical protein